MRSELRPRWNRAVAALQGLYYAATGLWPLVSLQTFMVVTGPKTDTWLVQTVGVLVLAIALPLLLAAARGQVRLETRILGLGSAAGFALVDVVFFLQEKIGAIYLADAVAELALVAAWLIPGTLRRTRPKPASDAGSPPHGAA